MDNAAFAIEPVVRVGVEPPATALASRHFGRRRLIVCRVVCHGLIVYSGHFGFAPGSQMPRPALFRTPTQAGAPGINFLV